MAARKRLARLQHQELDDGMPIPSMNESSPRFSNSKQTRSASNDQRNIAATTFQSQKSSSNGDIATDSSRHKTQQSSRIDSRHRATRTTSAATDADGPSKVAAAAAATAAAAAATLAATPPTKAFMDPLEDSFDFAAAERDFFPKPRTPKKERSRSSPAASPKAQTAVIPLSKFPPPRSSPVRRGKLKALVHEQISILFDDVASPPACRVSGAIFLQSSTHPKEHVYVIIRDPKAHLEQSECFGKAANDVKSKHDKYASEPFTEVVRVRLEHKEHLEGPIFCYRCSPRVRPIPLLLKTKVQHLEGICRVGVRIRANPGNKFALTQIAIIMVVPPDMIGETVSMSKKDGVWDGLKRTISWTLDSLAPSKTVEIRAQFEAAERERLQPSKFPVLIKCNAANIASGIEVSLDSMDQYSARSLDVRETSNVLYRKVD